MYVPKTSRRRPWDKLQRIKFFILFITYASLCGVDAKAIDPVDPELETTALVELGSWSELWVKPLAEVLSTPKIDNNELVFQEWLLKANDGSSTIALSIIGADMDLSQPNISFFLEVRDGYESDSPLIGWIYCQGEDLGIGWDFLFPKKATSGFLLLTLVNRGSSPPQIDFAYYLCGGTITPSTRITTPYFPGMNSPGIIDCEWNLKKPDDAIYGCLTPIKMNVTNCLSLQMISNDSMHVIERIDHTTTKNRSDTVETTRSSINSSQNTEPYLPEHTDKYNRTYSSSARDIYVQPICGNLIQMIAFEEGLATLKYTTKHHSSTPEFVGDFRVLRVPQPAVPKPRPIPWFYDFISLIVFVPIGFILGVTIIRCQGRKCKTHSPAITVTSCEGDGILTSKLIQENSFLSSTSKMEVSFDGESCSEYCDNLTLSNYRDCDATTGDLGNMKHIPNGDTKNETKDELNKTNRSTESKSRNNLKKSTIKPKAIRLGKERLKVTFGKASDSRTRIKSL